MRSILFIAMIFSTIATATVDDAYKAAKEGDFVGSEKSLRTYLMEDPNNWQQRYNLGVLLFQQKKNEEALKEFELAENTDDLSLKSKALYNQGIVAISQGDLKTSLLKHKNALSYDLSNEAIKENIVWLEEQLEKQEQQPQDQ